MDLFTIIFIVFMVGVVCLFSSAVKRRPKAPDRQKEWANTYDLIGGERSGRKILGSYRGRPVEAFIKNKGYEMSSFHYYIRLKVKFQGSDWALCYGTTSIFSTTNHWYIKTSDEDLLAKLSEAGAIELAKQAPGVTLVKYRADRGTIELEKYVLEGDFIPPPEEFKAQLDMLTRLAELNEELNSW